MDEKKTPSPKKRIKKPRKISESYLYNSGLYYLQRYTASIAHFQSVMTRKIKRSLAEHQSPDLDTCLDWLDDTIRRLKDEGYLNDTAYARGMVTSLRRKGLSSNGIKTKLRYKGLGNEDIQTALAYVDESIMDMPSALIQDYGLPDTIEYRSALTFARKKRLGPFSKTPLEGDDKAYKRQLSAFARGGFSYDISQAIMNLPHQSQLDAQLAAEL